jgi:hypothetical protein
MPPAAPAFGGQLAARVAGATDPDVLGVLQSPTVDQRVLATLAVIAATQPVAVQDISTVEGEDDSGTPRRDITLRGPRQRLQGVAAFFERQVGPFAVHSLDLTANGLKVRFPVRAMDIGLGTGPAPLQGGPAMLRVADLRHSRPAEQLNLVRIDGTAVGSLDASDDANPSGYLSMPAGTYVVVTNRAGGAPVIRQVLTLNPGVTYTLALFSAAESSLVAAQLAPDGPPNGPGPDSAVRVLDAASAAGSVYVALALPGVSEPMVLVNQAGYGLITGYAAVPAGQYEAVVTANGREWRQPVEFPGGVPVSLLLTDGPDGPLLRTLRDLPEAPTALNPPTLTMPASGDAVDKTKAKMPAIERSDGRWIAVVLCVAALVGAAVLMARARAPRRPEQQNDASPHDGVRARWHEVVRRARPVDNTTRLDLDVDNTARLDLDVDNTARLDPDVDNTARLDPDVDNTARLDRDVDNTARLDRDVDNTARLDPDTGAVEPSVPPRRPRQQKDASLHEAVRARWREVVRRARPVDNTARLDPDVDNTARPDLDAGDVEPSVPREPR